LDTPIVAVIKICMPVPASYSKARRQACLDTRELPTKKPDWDNVAKAITDSLNGIVYVDDCQIVSVYITKRYSIEAGVDVTIREEIL
jgi:Holliday junction resolvase RusA-like endonuclease